MVGRIVGALSLLIALGECTTDMNGEGHPPSADLCPSGSAIEVDGKRSLALVVGVGKYKNPEIPDLEGPPNDARRFYQLLTGKGGFGFPPQNVCLLLDENATTAAFKQAFEKALVSRAQPDDVAVLFFAGHGSLAIDRNGDEPDERDETLIFHDARVGGVWDLIDDELNAMLGRLQQKTRHVTVILDSCNSGTATRGEDANTFRSRFFDKVGDPPAASTSAGGDGDGGPVSETLPGLIVFSAARDGTSAMEKDGHGVFTDAVLQVLSQASAAPITYSQAARRIPPLVAAAGVYQVPYFHGDLTGFVFGNRSRTTPLAWEVIEAGEPLKLGGPPLPGFGVGAELRVYDGSATGEVMQNPGKAKATVVITQTTGLNARASISSRNPGSAAPAPGDLATLVRPGDDALKIKVRLRPSREAGGIPSETVAKIRHAIDAHPRASLVVGTTEGPGDFELGLGAGGQLVLRGPEGRIRNVFADAGAAAEGLWLHARQRTLLVLRGEGGADFTDQETLKVQVIPARTQSPCAKPEQWEQAPSNEPQVVPLCFAWNIKVTLSADAPLPLLVGGVILSTDGAVLGFPYDGRKILLQPGSSVVFDQTKETFQGRPPLSVDDQVIVFGTQETNPVPWHLMSTPAAMRGPGAGPLASAIGSMLPGTRGTGVYEGESENTTWTRTSLTTRVEANLGFLKPRSPNAPIDPREYTIKRFDIRPYLPDDKSSALYRVLKTADWLSSYSATDGIGYKQHAWDKPTIEGNLKAGIDCSRAIWFAFTRAGYEVDHNKPGLPYNRKQAYLNTADMVTQTTWMKDQFEVCSGALRLGDVLVYRDDTRKRRPPCGHVVMVIDPDKRIAWGSHGWDGEGRQPGVSPDTGVEYQLIKYKQDWQRWDSTDMERAACWRYRTFDAEARSSRGQQGADALAAACDPRSCR
jgi:hypothetical protein